MRGLGCGIAHSSGAFGKDEGRAVEVGVSEEGEKGGCLGGREGGGED